MPFGNNMQGKRCARCHQPLALSMIYRDSLWFHARCFSDGARQLSNAMRLAEECIFMLPFEHPREHRILCPAEASE